MQKAEGAAPQKAEGPARVSRHVESFLEMLAAERSARTGLEEEKAGLAARVTQAENEVAHATAQAAQSNEAQVERQSQEVERLAQELAGKEKPQDALELMQLHAELHDDSSHMEFLLGELQSRSGNKDKAILHFKKALELDPDNRPAKQRLKQLEEDS